MQNKLHLIEKTSQIVCVWLSTGDNKRPLAFKWIEVPMAAGSEASQRPAGRIRLCA